MTGEIQKRMAGKECGRLYIVERWESKIEKRYAARNEARECGVKYVQIYDTVDITTNGSVAGAGHGSMAKLFLRRAIAILNSCIVDLHGTLS